LPRGPGDGLSHHLHDATLSIATSIVEGATLTGKDFERALDLAKAALARTAYLLVVCRDLGYLPPRVTDPLIRKVPGIERTLRTLRSFGADICRLQSPVPELAELAGICLESTLDCNELAPFADDVAKDSRPAKSATPRSSARARKAAGPRSRRKR
jgi:four helix bundle protein